MSKKTTTRITEDCNKSTTATIVAKVGAFLNRNAIPLACTMLCVLMMCGTAFASADTLWNTLSGEIQKWVTRLGAVVMLIGGIMFGLGWKDDDASRKTAGINTMIAGGIVIAIANLTATFFNAA